jgi:UMF1 family MFS transporter
MGSGQILYIYAYDAAVEEPLWSLPFFQTLPEVIYIAFVTVLAVFITGAYSSSRTMLARLAPREMMTQFFGVYALSGKAIAFLAPLTVAFFTDISQSQRIGFASSGIFLVIGLIIMFFVKEERATID